MLEGENWWVLTGLSQLFKFHFLTRSGSFIFQIANVF